MMMGVGVDMGVSVDGLDVDVGSGCRWRSPGCGCECTSVERTKRERRLPFLGNGRVSQPGPGVTSATPRSQRRGGASQNASTPRGARSLVTPGKCRDIAEDRWRSDLERLGLVAPCHGRRSLHRPGLRHVRGCLTRSLLCLTRSLRHVRGCRFLPPNGFRSLIPHFLLPSLPCLPLDNGKCFPLKPHRLVAVHRRLVTHASDLGPTLGEK